MSSLLICSFLCRNINYLKWIILFIGCCLGLAILYAYDDYSNYDLYPTQHLYKLYAVFNLDKQKALRWRDTEWIELIDKAYAVLIDADRNARAIYARQQIIDLVHWLCSLQFVFCMLAACGAVFLIDLFILCYLKIMSRYRPVTTINNEIQTNPYTLLMRENAVNRPNVIGDQLNQPNDAFPDILQRFVDEVIRRQEADRREAMLNEIFMQLLDQLDYGAPPIAQQQLDRISDVEIDAYQVANSSRCTMCLDDFRLNERVRRLPCQHYFHRQCIVQWLLRHNTCPICRKPVQIDENPSPPLRARHRMAT